MVNYFVLQRVQVWQHILKDKKLNEVYYQPDHHLCTDGKEIRELCKIVPTTKKDARHG